MTPTHFPVANKVAPIYATVPRWPFPITSTTEPSWKTIRKQGVNIHFGNPLAHFVQCLHSAEKDLTFGGLLLSTDPELLILLIRGLVSWRIWKIQMQEKVDKGKGKLWREKRGRFCFSGSSENRVSGNNFKNYSMQRIWTMQDFYSCTQMEEITLFCAQWHVWKVFQVVI